MPRAKPRRVRARKPRVYRGRRGPKGCVEHREARSTKGWAAQKPSSGQRIRRGIVERCGAGAFAVKTKSGEYKFPLVNPKTCCTSCLGTREAYGRASQHKRRYPGVAKKIKSLAARKGCRWARGR
jgi:hypothetical protein